MPSSGRVAKRPVMNGAVIPTKCQTQFVAKQKKLEQARGRYVTPHMLFIFEGCLLPCVAGGVMQISCENDTPTDFLPILNLILSTAPQRPKNQAPCLYCPVKSRFGVLSSLA